MSLYIKIEHTIFENVFQDRFPLADRLAIEEECYERYGQRLEKEELASLLQDWVEHYRPFSVNGKSANYIPALEKTTTLSWAFAY